MKVFLSWSGDRSRQVAEALKEWIPLVLQYAEPWVSAKDIDAGARWGNAIAGELEASDFGILCATAENLTAPWLLFEAGALAKSLEHGRVVPALFGLDVREVEAPLAQFQAKKLDRDGTLDILKSIQTAAARPLADQQLATLFDTMWPQLEARLGEVPAAVTAKKSERSTNEILDEVVATMRSLEARVRDLPGESEPRMPRSMSLSSSDREAFRSMFDVASHAARGPGDPILLAAMASLLRDELPLVHHLATSLADALITNKSTAARDARLEQLFVVCRATLEGRDRSRMSETAERALREILEFLDQPRRRSPNIGLQLDE